MRKVNSLKQIRKCLPQLLKAFTFRFNKRAWSILLLPLTAIIFLPVKGKTSSFKITMDGPSGIPFRFLIKCHDSCDYDTVYILGKEIKMGKDVHNILRMFTPVFID